MATATTSAQTIRENRRDAIEGLRPGQHRQVRMREYKRNGDFRAWAESKPAACFRRFQVRDLVTYEIPTISDVLTEEVKTQFEIVVAYPASGQFGSDTINGLEDAIRADQILLETALGAVAHGDYPSGCNLFQLASVDIEREEDVYFLVAIYDVLFKRDVTLDVLDLNASAAITSAATVAAVSSLINNFQGVANITASAAVTGAGTIDYSQVGAITASATVTAAAVFAAGGPTLLADFDFSAPTTVGIGGNGTFASANATDEWLLQETSGTHANNVGSETLANTGGYQGQTAAGLWDGSSYVARNAFESDATAANADRLTSSGTTAGDSNSADIAGRIVFRMLSNVASNVLFSKRDGVNAGWQINTASNSRFQLVMEDASANQKLYTSPNNSIACDGSWNVIEFWYDFSADLMYAKTQVLASTSTSTAGMGTTTNAANLIVNGRTSNDGHEQTQYAYAGVSVGANAQAFYDETVVLPGADPSGLLTTQTRGSLISVPVSATQVAHFTDDALPIGYNSNFSDTDKLGLYCNSAVTNLLTYSEALSNWASSNMTETDNFGDSPDGFRSATKLAATADNGYSALTFTTVAATEYTLSCYVKEITVGCTGRVIFYDETGAVELASQVFTCTSANQLISVTATTNAGQVSSSMRIEIDTNTEECYAWGCQANLGDKRGAYIRTDGSSAALAQCDFEAVGTAGQFADASQQGEMEIIWTKGLTTATVPYVCAFGSTSALQNAKLHINSAQTNVQLWNWDSASAQASNVAVATGDPFEENLDILQWDPAGGLSAAAGAEAAVDHGSGTATSSEVGTYTGTNTLTRIQIGNAVHTSSAALNGYIQQIRTWDGER